MKLNFSNWKLFVPVLLGLFLLNLTNCGNNAGNDETRVLVFSKTVGFVHSSIPNGIAAIQQLGQENNFLVDTTKNADYFQEDSLQQYAAVVFLNTTGDVLNHQQEAAFERYIQAGGGFVGVHAATDTEYGWNWYGRMVGGYFQSHPATQEATFVITDREFPATEFFEDTLWRRTDELYNFRNRNEDVNVIMTVDESTYEGGENGDYHPMSWYHEYDGGRAFYTALGHTEESYSDEKYLKHLLGGIQYAIGDNVELDYSQARSQLPPDGDRFSKNILAMGVFYEPTEMTILPNKDVLIAQRRGELMRYEHSTGTVSEIAKLDVYHQSGVPRVNAEEGFMGLQKDPNFAENNWIYAFYSPTGYESVNRLSRFKYTDGNFDLGSEQVILDVGSQRKICCHTGGSIAFGPDGLLYLSTGDNSTPFDEPNAQFVNNGYAPLNDLPGKQQYDARRSSGNTNDLRGKIIRIKVNEDGSYDIPEGNLFPPGTDKTRPEIYTMGHRNPYRISVDPKNGYLYWGEVGPDSREDNFETRGPRGYDEMNQAREAGNYGWPLFIADNKPYRDYDYSNGTSGAAFDPEKPINDSKHNTGLRELPPTKPAYVFYDYGQSTVHPGLASGGRNAMAGPVYYSDLYEGENELPAYYDGKVLVYDWIRGWIKAVSLFPDGTFNKLEPFAPEIELNNLIDMEVGPDGTIYLLEYGSGWFSKNDDAALSIIEYNDGNRPPVITDFTVDKTSGPLPLQVEMEVAAMDREQDDIMYAWSFGDGNFKETKDPRVTYTYEQGGFYPVSVEVVDDEKASAKSAVIPITAGNSMPEIAIEVSGGNSSFFVPGVPVAYKVSVQDQEDGSDGIDPSKIYVAVDYLDGYDEAERSMGHQQVSVIAQGEALTLAMDCKACHKANEASVGPSYIDIAERYKDDDNAVKYLKGKIATGGGGVWGEVVMPAHPDISDAEAEQITQYIRSLAGQEMQNESLPAAGTIVPEAGMEGKVMVITASYTDQGGTGAKPLTGTKTLALRGSTVPFTKDKVKVEGFVPISFGEMDLILTPHDGGWFAIQDVDLKGIKSANIMAGWQDPPAVGMEIEMRLDGPDGKLLGVGKMPVPQKGQQGGVIPIQLKENVEGKGKDVYFVYKPSDGQKLGADENVGLMNVSFSGT